MANQNLDEDLIARNADAENSQQTEQEPTEEEINESLRLQELDELRQSQRLATQRSAAQRIQSVQQTAQTALKWYKRYSKTVLVIEFLAATFPIWGTLLLALLILVGFVGGCNSSTSFRIASLGSCEPFILSSTTTVPTTQPNNTTNPQTGFQPADLVTLVGLVNVDANSTSDPRARQCMATRVQQIFADAQAAGLDITITSAFRGSGLTANGNTSAHGRGEAVDISLRNPSVAVRSNDPRITQLMSIALRYFPNGVQTNSLNEYANPAENATGGHIHVEFNIPNPATNSYCAPFPNPPTS